MNERQYFLHKDGEIVSQSGGQWTNLIDAESGDGVMVLVDDLDGLVHPGHLGVHVLPRGEGPVIRDGGGGRRSRRLHAQPAHVGLRLGHAARRPRVAPEDALDEDPLHGLLADEVLPEAADRRHAVAARPARKGNG